MRLITLREDPNADKALNYPGFLLKVGEGLVPGTKDGDDRSMLPLSVRKVQEFKHLIPETFYGTA